MNTTVLKLSTKQIRMLLDVIDANNASPSRFHFTNGDGYFFANDFGRIVGHFLTEEKTIEMSDADSLSYKLGTAAYFDADLEETLRCHIAGTDSTKSSPMHLTTWQIRMYMDVIDANNASPSRFYFTNGDGYYILNDFGQVVCYFLTAQEKVVMDDEKSSNYKAHCAPYFYADLEDSLRKHIASLI